MQWPNCNDCVRVCNGNEVYIHKQTNDRECTNSAGERCVLCIAMYTEVMCSLNRAKSVHQLPHHQIHNFAH